MKISYIVRRGEKELCEDAALIGTSAVSEGFGETAARFPFWAGAADGVGGNPGGALAAQFVTCGVLGLKPSSPEELRESLVLLNRRLIEYGNALGVGRMASAFTGCYFTGGRCIAVHSGNTRLWRLVDGRFLREVTQDHTVCRMLKDAGRSTEGCNKSEINCCFGGGDERLLARLECFEPFQRGVPGSLMFTSDGIHDHLGPDEMESLLSGGGSLPEKLERLAAAAYDAGSRDDLTCVMVTDTQKEPAG